MILFHFQIVGNHIKEYIQALIKEINTYNEKECKVSSIYFGGGTPSFIESKYIKIIMENIKNKFELEKNCEITIEANPGTINKEKLEDYKKSGINRLSIGLQTTDNKLLKQIGRIHNYEQFVENYKLARNVGFKNINVDLILGLPNQNIEKSKKDLETVLKLEPEHISTYSLIIEEGTVLAEKIKKGELELPEEQTERKMYWNIKKELEEKGYEHYEISNFAKPGKYSKHNVNCWNQKEYIGMGLSAHSYLHMERYSNITNLKKYIENIKNKEMYKNRIIHEIQSKEEQQKEFMLLGLRKIKGISIKEFENNFTENPLAIYKEELKRLKKQELIEITEEKIKLTNKGIDFANIVWQEFV